MEAIVDGVPLLRSMFWASMLVTSSWAPGAALSRPSATSVASVA